MGKIILTASGKGGCGKSTFAVNLGYTLAAAGLDTLLVDFNIGLRNLDLYLGLQDRVLFDFGDYLAGTCKLRKAVVTDGELDKLHLLSCPQIRDIKGLSRQHVSGLLSELRGLYDAVIVDAPTGIGELIRDLASCADAGVLIVTPNFSSIRNAETVSKRLEGQGLAKRFHVINRVRAGSTDPSLPRVEDIEKAVTVPLIGIIPEDENIDIGNNAGRPVVSARDSYIARNFEGIAARLMG